MHPSIYCSTNPLDIGGVLQGEMTQMFSHDAEFDNHSLSAQAFFTVTFNAMLNPRNTTGANSGGSDMLGLPYYGHLTFSCGKC